MSDAMIEFLSNTRAAMYMPAPKTSEGSSNTPSNANVLKATVLLQQAVKEIASATIEPSQERTHEASSSPDSENLFENNAVEVLMKRITALEEDKIMFLVS
ncbi:hypothetical protein Hanom_Chr13g01207201 [Helianthus anomalus]